MTLRQITKQEKVMLRFVCWQCGKSLKASPVNAGKKCRCSGCDELNTIPSHGVEIPPADPNEAIEIDFERSHTSADPNESDPFDFTSTPKRQPKPVLEKGAHKSAGTGMVFCYKCANSIFEEAEICPHCGCRQKRNSARAYRDDTQGLGTSANPSRVVAFLLAFFLGGLGVHKFYLGQISMGMLYLVCFFLGFLLFFIPTFVVLVISFVESIMYLAMSDEEFASKYGR
jgi:TM2 domain-containing membrane protein YozV